MWRMKGLKGLGKPLVLLPAPSNPLIIHQSPTLCSPSSVCLCAVQGTRSLCWVRPSLIHGPPQGVSPPLCPLPIFRMGRTSPPLHKPHLREEIASKLFSNPYRLFYQFPLTPVWSIRWSKCVPGTRQTGLQTARALQSLQGALEGEAEIQFESTPESPRKVEAPQLPLTQ